MESEFEFLRINAGIKILLGLDTIKGKTNKQSLLDRVSVKGEEILSPIPTAGKSKGRMVMIILNW